MLLAIIIMAYVTLRKKRDSATKKKPADSSVQVNKALRIELNADVHTQQ